MPDPSRLALFALASLLLAVVPGPAVLYIVGQAVHRGRLAGLVSTLGIKGEPFHYDGGFDVEMAIRNLYIETRGVGTSVFGSSR